MTKLDALKAKVAEKRLETKSTGNFAGVCPYESGETETMPRVVTDSQVVSPDFVQGVDARSSVL